MTRRQRAGSSLRRRPLAEEDFPQRPALVGGILNYKTPGKVVSGTANAAGNVASGAVKTTGKVAATAANAAADTVKGTVNAAKDALKGLGGLFKKSDSSEETK